jgi:hypothetical protein
MNGTVESCPGNATAAAEASSRLGCGRDEYGNDQYICVPNDSKTALVEFCHDGIMRLIQEGIVPSKPNLTPERTLGEPRICCLDSL